MPPSGDFKTFLLLNPQLANGGMFLHFYSKKLMLQTAEARTQVGHGNEDTGRARE